MAREEIVELIPALRAFAWTFCSNPEDADDLVQETLVRAINSFDQYKEGTRLKSWLFTIMRNTFSTRYRKRKRETVGIPDGMLNTLTTPATQEWSAHARDVHSALMRIPQQYRDVLVLVTLMNESYEEVAKIHGCRVGTIKSRMNRARQRLKEELGELDDTDTQAPSENAPPRGASNDANEALTAPCAVHGAQRTL
ncbi:RNA polymerase sigma-70 factor (ECF subfamily) [Agrobacterium vitis]|nr:RNA polymerase sigma-70 factor (ECF subfamily) [Agrobacterium vitis]